MKNTTQTYKTAIDRNLAVMHGYLSKPKIRGFILFPPLLLCIVGVIVALVHAYTNFGFKITHFVQYLFLFSAVWLLLSLWLILWSDFKREMRDNNCA